MQAILCPQENAARALVTPFDMHETLLDIVKTTGNVRKDNSTVPNAVSAQGEV